MTQLQQDAVPARLFARGLSDYLETDGRVSAADLLRARAAAEAADKRLDQALLDLGLLTEATLSDLLTERFAVDDVSADRLPLAPVLESLLKPNYLAASRMFPLTADDTTLSLAMVDPFDDFAANAVALKTGLAVRRLRISRQRFESAFEGLYGASLSPIVGADETAPAEAMSGDVDLLKDAASDAPVIRFVQDAIRLAVEKGASDIHLRPARNRAEMFLRLNGQLVPQAAPELRMLPSVISRLKVLANLDIAERRLPQDGRIRANVAGRPVDISLSTMPHVHGEAAVLRLLSRELAVSSLGELGFSPEIETGLEELFGVADGLVLVTGPTGSGKTTTLHAALKRLIRPELNVVTIEDPVEYRVDGAAQIQVDDKIGLTFPRVLRSLLRQDPDIILVGEIRDAETAKIAVQAALTGHLVLATLHTNSAPAAIPRLVDMGVEPYLLAAVLRGVVAQRLVRRLCPHCATATDGTKQTGPGCGHCGGSGYAGRIAVGELLRLEPDVTETLARSLELTTAMANRLRQSGYRPLREDARRRVQAGEIASVDVLGMVDVG
ncbi:MAG: type II/IV secretion system protein [Devosia nanyangense]|uniref:Type II/IV secretion system protein n=1 Tax=Devosia nanyangense TaxID=1228055 RepID=A0A933L856_9HYPH|nr:type II/IV secretion system protein [Devosia nanyangense]